MTTLHHPDLARLARVIAALCQGQTIRLPFIETGRGHVQDEIRLGRDDEGDRQDEILQRTTHLSRSGIARPGVFQVVNWSLDDLMVLSSAWPADTIAALPPAESLAQRRGYDVLTQLDREATALLGGMTIRLDPRIPSHVEPCAIAIVFPNPVSGEYSAAELARMK